MACILSELDLPELKTNSFSTVDTPGFEEVRRINVRAYGMEDGTGGAAYFAHVVNIRDPRFKTHGLREGHGGAFVCVAVTVTIDDDVGIHWVATEEAYRSRGLASKLIHALLKQARDDGVRTASLQSSPDGLGVYKKLGFRQVATMRGFVRPVVGDLQPVLE